RLPGDDGARRGGEAPPGLRRVPARRARPRRRDRAAGVPPRADRGARRRRGRSRRRLAGAAQRRRELPRVLGPPDERRARRPRRTRTCEEEGGGVIELIDELEAGELSVEFEGMEPQELLAWSLERFAPRIALSTAFQIDGVALLDMLCELTDDVRVFSVDTGRLPGETYALIESLRERYPQMRLDLLAPDPRQLQRMVARNGPNLFYESVESRLVCCNIRKVQPLTKHLAGL